jgi:1-acyl-sn-glycerol-3-phosphate acyltransferase
MAAGMNTLRSLAFLLISVLVMLVLAILCLPLLVLAPAVAARVTRWIAGFQLTLLRHVVGLDVEMRGLEYLPDTPVLIAAKHQSVLETYALTAFLPTACFVLKREIVKVPLAGWYVRSLDVVAVDRSGGSTALKDMVRKAKEAVAAGRHIVIFPEGTRTRPGESARYHPGVAALYGALDIPVVPVALNTGLFWPRKSLTKSPGTAVIAFLEPIAPGMARKDFMAALSDRIESGTNRLIGETNSVE